MAVAKAKGPGRRRSRNAAPGGRGGAGPRAWAGRALLGLALCVALAVGAVAVLPPPATPYMLAERWRLGEIRHDWVAMEAIAPVMARAAVAAEDADFCRHWGFDIAALRRAIAGGMRRGGSTISQQTAKNVYLWQGRSWPRKALEAGLTPLIEAVWTKRRILEVYLNVAEMGEGVFGVQAAARHHFGTDAAALTPGQAARLAAILPAPKDRSPTAPSAFVERRARAIADGAATIARDGRAACFGG